MLIEAAGVLFDMDGVLIDSTPAVERVWKRWAVEHGFDPDYVVAKAHGRPSMTTIRELLPGSDYDAENRIVEQREISDLAGVRPLPGALELLTSLPRHRWTIVTSSTRALAEVRLRTAGLPSPEKFVTASDVTHGKPHPEPYAKGAAVLGLAPESCIVVEDAPAGVRAGKAAGARVIGISTIASSDELRAAGADWVCTNCADIRVQRSGDFGVELELCERIK